MSCVGRQAEAGQERGTRHYVELVEGTGHVANVGLVQAAKDAVRACDGQEAAAVEHERGLEWSLRRCGHSGASGRLLALALLGAETFHVGRLGRWDGGSRDEAHRGSRGKAAEVERK